MKNMNEQMLNKEGIEYLNVQLFFVIFTPQELHSTEKNIVSKSSLNFHIVEWLDFVEQTVESVLWL